MFEHREPVARLRAFALREAAHLGVELRIVEERIESRDLADFAAISADRGDDVVEFRQFARKRNEGCRIGTRGETIRNFGVTAQNEIELVLRQHDFLRAYRGDPVNAAARAQV